MGRSFSVFLFCLAMDPIYHYLNRIPRVMSVQGYIDDNTIAGPGHDIAWVSRVHYCYQCCETAGFQIDQHTCWQALSSDCPPFSLQQVADRRERQLILRLPTFPTARAAILATLLPRKTLILVRADKCIGLPPREASGILQGFDYTPLSPLLALECSCRCKAALVINTPLPSSVLRQIDQAGFGAHCIQGVATSLGLLLLGRAQLANQGLWTLTSHPTTLKQINPKAAEKFIHRLRLFRHKQIALSNDTRSASAEHENFLTGCGHKGAIIWRSRTDDQMHGERKFSNSSGPSRVLQVDQIGTYSASDLQKLTAVFAEHASVKPSTSETAQAANNTAMWRHGEVPPLGPMSDGRGRVEKQLDYARTLLAVTVKVTAQMEEVVRNLEQIEADHTDSKEADQEPVEQDTLTAPQAEEAGVEPSA